MGQSTTSKIRKVLFQAMMFIATAVASAPGNCIPFVTVQQLLQNPNAHNRQVIVVEGWLHRGEETVSLQAVSQPFQKEHIWLENIEFIKATERTIPHTKKERATIEPMLDPAAQEKYRELFAIDKSAHIVLKGEFQTSKGKKFGHLAAFRHRIIVYEVISIEK